MMKMGIMKNGLTAIRHITITFVICCLSIAGSSAQEEVPPNHILFTNVNVFDGVSETLKMNVSVLVEDNLIKSVGPSITAPEGAEVIDGGGRTLMPGLIDSHVHLNMYKDSTLVDLQNSTWE